MVDRISLRVNLRSSGADLRTIGRELKAMDDRKVTDLFKRRLEPVARTFVPLVQASVMAIPTTGTKHTGLRARIAACAQTATWGHGREVNVSVEMNPKKMPPGELSLPLGMEGEKRWRHPVYGNREEWVTQPPHPYFYQAADGYGRAAGDALRAALEDITWQVNG